MMVVMLVSRGGVFTGAPPIESVSTCSLRAQKTMRKRESSFRFWPKGVVFKIIHASFTSTVGPSNRHKDATLNKSSILPRQPFHQRGKRGDFRYGVRDRRFRATYCMSRIPGHRPIKMLRGILGN